jgi:hypothetical protein
MHTVLNRQKSQDFAVLSYKNYNLFNETLSISVPERWFATQMQCRPGGSAGGFPPGERITPVKSGGYCPADPGRRPVAGRKIPT